MKKTQGRKLITLLKQRGYTNMELQMTGISTCHWKRISESLEEGEILTKRKNARGLNVYRVENVYQPKTVWVK